jgi:hypothetical protein
VSQQCGAAFRTGLRLSARRPPLVTHPPDAKAHRGNDEPWLFDI